jgi:hypothetical protein
VALMRLAMMNSSDIVMSQLATPFLRIAGVGVDWSFVFVGGNVVLSSDWW